MAEPSGPAHTMETQKIAYDGGRELAARHLGGHLATGQPLQWINSTRRYSHEQKHNTRLARAHVAHRNRKLKSAGQQHNAIACSVAARVTRPRDKQEDLGAGANLLEPSNRTRGDRKTSLAAVGTMASSKPLSFSTSLSRAPTSLLGPCATETSDLHTPSSEEAMKYLLDVFWPNTLMNIQSSRTWLQLFSESPMLFHCAPFAAATHRDMLCNSESWSRSRETLEHKSQALNHLRRTLPALDGSNIDKAILAVMILATTDLQNPRQTEETSLFDAHMPGANWLSIFGRVDIVETHVEALLRLIDLRGGLSKIEIPELGSIIAFCDLYRSSPLLRTPHFPCYWSIEIRDVLSSIAGLPSDSILQYAGRSFQDVSGLTSECIAVYRHLASIDHAMSQCRRKRLSDGVVHTLADLRNLGQHRLLSLPEWDNVGDDVRRDQRRGIYECSRLTALLYSNLVLFPLPSDDSWKAQLLGKLKKELELSARNRPEDHTPDVMVWSLVICALASFRTRYRRWFESALKWELLRRQAKTKTALHDLASGFLWTNSACLRGAERLWSAIGLEE